MRQEFNGYKPVYNMWLIREDDPSNYKYCSTVIADTFTQAVTKTIRGCGIELLELEGWRFTRGNPRFNPEEQELLRGSLRDREGY